MPILDREVDLFPGDLFEIAAGELQAARNDDGPTGEAPLWWSVYTRSRHEKSFMRRLLDLNVPFYGPTVERRYRSRGGRVRHAHMPLFSNYVFLFATQQQRYAAMTTNCVSQCLPVADGIALTQDLDQIHRLITSGAAITPEATIAPGDRVRVRTGPFAGFEGIVVRRQNEVRLMIVVEFMQQGASVMLDDCQVDVLDKSSTR